MNYMDDICNLDSISNDDELLVINNVFHKHKKYIQQMFDKESELHNLIEEHRGIDNELTTSLQDLLSLITKLFILNHIKSDKST